MTLSEKAQQQFLKFPGSGLRDRTGISNPLTVYSSADLKGVVVAAAGTEPEDNLPSEEAIRAFKLDVALRVAPLISEEELNEFDAAIKAYDAESEAAIEEFEAFYHGVLERLHDRCSEEALTKLDEELAKVERIGGAR